MQQNYRGIFKQTEGLGEGRECIGERAGFIKKPPVIALAFPAATPINQMKMYELYQYP